MIVPSVVVMEAVVLSITDQFVHVVSKFDCPLLRSSLTICIPKTTTYILWQTVKSQTKA